MSKNSSIKVFAENVGDTNPRPVNDIPVWIENVSAIGGGGGGDIPTEVSGKWEDASNCVQTNSASWDDSVKKTAGSMQRINMGGGMYIDLGLSNITNTPGVRINGKSTLGTNYLNVIDKRPIANIDNTVTIFGEVPSIEIKNNKTNVSSKLTNTELSFKNGADLATLNLYDISALKSSSGAGGTVSLPITGTDSLYTSAFYGAEGITYEVDDREGEPDIRTLNIMPGQIYLTATLDEENYFGFTLADDHLTLTSQYDPNCQGDVNAESISSWNGTYSTVQSNSASWGQAPQIEFVSNSAAATGSNILYVVTGSN